MRFNENVRLVHLRNPCTCPSTVITYYSQSVHSCTAIKEPLGNKVRGKFHYEYQTVKRVTDCRRCTWVEFSSSLFKKNDKIGGPPPRERELLNLLFSYFPSFDFITVNFFFSKKARSDDFFFLVKIHVRFLDEPSAQRYLQAKTLMFVQLVLRAP